MNIDDFFEKQFVKYTMIDGKLEEEVIEAVSCSDVVDLNNAAKGAIESDLAAFFPNTFSSKSIFRDGELCPNTTSFKVLNREESRLEFNIKQKILPDDFEGRDEMMKQLLKDTKIGIRTISPFFDA